MLPPYYMLRACRHADADDVYYAISLPDDAALMRATCRFLRYLRVLSPYAMPLTPATPAPCRYADAYYDITIIFFIIDMPPAVA